MMSLVRTRSRGASRRPVMVLAMPTTTRLPKGLGEEVRSKPEKPAAPVTIKLGPKPPGSGPVMSGKPTRARRRLRTKLSVVRRRME